MQDFFAEALDHLREHLLARRLQFMNDPVGVDDHGTPCGEPRGHRRLSRSDASGEPHENHAGRLSNPPVSHTTHVLPEDADTTSDEAGNFPQVLRRRIGDGRAEPERRRAHGGAA